jgi:hypothetical protein
MLVRMLVGAIVMVVGAIVMVVAVAVLMLAGVTHRYSCWVVG